MTAVAARRAAGEDPAPERHWRDDPRALRTYGWLTVLWAGTFLLRVLVQTPLYIADEVELLGTVSLVLGLPLTAVVGVAHPGGAVPPAPLPLRPGRTPEPAGRSRRRRRPPGR